VLHIVSADLHIHTCLSPCADLGMTPIKIVRRAITAGLSIIAITDHNSAGNVSSVTAAARGTGLCVIPGIEITTSEEVHIVGLFESCEDALGVQGIVFDHLMPGENDEKLFGMQVIANEHDEVEGFENRLLIGSSSLGVNRTIECIHGNKGIAIFSHIDREANSIIGQLGFIPADAPIDGIEISKHTGMDQARVRFREYERYPFIRSSDSHELQDIGSATTEFLIEEVNFNEIRMALKEEHGRKIAKN
jgi:PHP family Zn ribbon phosphoesterase